MEKFYTPIFDAMHSNLKKIKLNSSHLLLKTCCVLILILGQSAHIFGQTVTTITTSGTWTVPVGVTSVTVYTYGAGGGSGGAKGATNDNASGGGGGGACAISTLTVSAGQVYTVTIGNGGTAGAATGTAGGAGGASSFVGTGGTVSANGGGGGGGVAVTTGAAGTAGAGATIGTGTTIRFGGNGTPGYRTTTNEVGGAGGGGAGNAGNGGNGSGATGINTTGGAGGLGSPTGAPFAGAAGSGAILTVGSLAGVAGVAPGGGAAGCATYTAAAVGAIGGKGQVVLSYSITLPGCTGTPAAGTATITSATGCPSTNFTLNSSGVTTGTGITYQWQTCATVGGTYTNVGAAGSSLTTSTATTAYYQLKTTCSGSGLVNYTNVVSYTVASNFCACSAYPACNATSAADDEILNVTVGTLNNTSTCASLAGGAGSVVAMYSNYSGIVAAPSLMQGSSISSSVTIGFCSGTAYGTGFAVYIDYNQNGVFTDAGEMVYSPNATFTPAAAGTAYPFTFTVPAGATLGTTRMRIVDIEGSALPASTGTFTWGETEDYCVTIIAAPPCTGTPAPGNTLTSSASVASGSTVNLSLSTPPIGTGLTYAWQSGPSNTGPWTTIATTSTYTATVSATTWYRCLVTCSGNTGTATPVQVTVVACIPVGSITYYLTNVSTTGATTNFINATGASAGGYGNYYATIGTQVPQGTSVTVTMNSIYSSDFFQLWIDWNNDLDFLDAGEAVYNSAAYVASGVVTINVGAAQPLGTYRMRVSNGYLGANTPCGPAAYGEFEDYYIQVIAPPACFSPTALISSAITSTTATISWTAASPAPASGYQYYYSTVNTAPTAGTTPSGSTAAGITSANLTGLTVNTTYYFWVRSNCGGGNGTSVWAGASSFFTGYCIPTGTAGYYITNVTTTSGATNIANTTASNAGYGNFTAQSASNYIGTGTNFSVGHTATAGGAGVGVWIDWNNDLDFADVNEQIGLTTGWNYSPFTGTINIPVGTTVGNYIMRIVIDYSAISPISCPVGINGETEDYTFTVIALSPCSGTPSPGNSLTSSNSVASGSTVNLSLSTPPIGTGLTYAWQSASSNTGPWTTIASSATYTATVTAMTWYRCLVTCSGNTGTATPVQVTLTACIPTSTYGCTSGDVIARVILNTLDNNSGTGCPSGVAGYSNYTTNPALTTTLMPSSSYNCIVYAGAWAGDYAAWIDYNDNLVFELSERIGYTTSTIAANTSASFAVVLSCTPPAGQHLMRVREAYATAGSAIDPCAVYLWGEIEDYMITISAPPACASPGLMTTITPAANSATLTWATSCSAATNYDFQYGPAGFALGTGTMLTNQTVTIAAPNASFNLTGLTGGTAYTVYYRANCGGGVTSAWSIANNFSTLAVWKDAWVSMNTGAAVWCPGETRVVTVTVTNIGNMTWTNATPDINIGVKWNAEADYFVRTDANGLAPGATQTYSLSMTAPLVLGTNNLTFDLVSENNFWFASNANGAGPSNVIYTSATITISSPTVSAGAAMAAICQGTASAALGGSFGGTATSAVWSGGAGTFANNTGSTPGTATYTASASETGTITLTLTTSGGPCGTVFATKTIVVNANLPASVSIAASATTICDGTSVSFTATPTNGGAAPAYQWKVNGTNVGTNSATYTNAALANGNVVTCVLTSNATPCSTGSPATSNSITMVVNPNLPASISIAASATSICIGTSVTFTATPTNGGTTPAYQWKVNGANVGTGASTYASTTLANNDLVTCVLTSNASPCLTGSPATSNAVTITVNALPTVTANVTSTPICLGSTTTLTGGGASTYSWNNGASNAVSFAPAATTTYTVTGTSAAGCTNTASVLVTVNTPTVTAPVVAGTVVWHGATSVDFGTSSNWLAYNGTSYAVSASAPTASTNVIIPVTQGCVTQQPSVVLSGTVAANDVVIETGATLSMGSGTLNIYGNYTNNGTLVGGTGTLAFVGASGDQTITKTGGETITSMTVNKAAGNVILNNNVTVTGGLSLTSGLVVLGTNDLIMSGGGISNASAASYVKTSDTGVFKHNVGSSVFNFPIGNGAYNPIDLTNSGTSDLFSVRVIDGAPGTPNNAINRKWMVERAGTANVNVTMRLYWNGVGDESSAFTTSTGAMFIDHLTGGSWFNEGGTSNTASALNYVEKAGITSFSPFTVSRFATPLPVELMSLDAQCAGENVIVSWKTASEHNSLNFVVERSDDGTAWTEIQTVGAAGNSNTIIEYAIEDAGAARGVKYYRLIQVDQDGVQKIYGPILSNCGSDDNMFFSFPNPSDAEITIVFNDKNIIGSTTLTVRDAHGRVVRSMALEIQPGTTSILIPDMELEPAVYYLQLVGDNFTSPVIKHSLR